jgi:hypothetical protein
MSMTTLNGVAPGVGPWRRSQATLPASSPAIESTHARAASRDPVPVRQLIGRARVPGPKLERPGPVSLRFVLVVGPLIGDDEFDGVVDLVDLVDLVEPLSGQLRQVEPAPGVMVEQPGGEVRVDVAELDEPRTLASPRTGLAPAG